MFEMEIQERIEGALMLHVASIVFLLYFFFASIAATRTEIIACSGEARDVASSAEYPSRAGSQDATNVMILIAANCR